MTQSPLPTRGDTPRDTSPLTTSTRLALLAILRIALLAIGITAMRNS